MRGELRHAGLLAVEGRAAGGVKSAVIPQDRPCCPHRRAPGQGGWNCGIFKTCCEASALLERRLARHPLAHRDFGCMCQGPRKVIKHFQEDPETRVFLLTRGQGAAGLTLTQGMHARSVACIPTSDPAGERCLAQGNACEAAS
jgi:hypothetical protein